MALSTFDGWAGYSGGDVLLRVGDEWQDDHDLVKERPELFEVEQPPEDEPSEVEVLEALVKASRPLNEEETTGPEAAPVRKKPGPKPGTSRTKPQT